MVFTHIIFALKQIKVIDDAFARLVFTHIIFALKQIKVIDDAFARLVFTHIIFALKQMFRVLIRVYTHIIFALKQIADSHFVDDQKVYTHIIFALKQICQDGRKTFSIHIYNFYYNVNYPLLLKINGVYAYNFCSKANDDVHYWIVIFLDTPEYLDDTSCLLDTRHHSFVNR